MHEEKCPYIWVSVEGIPKMQHGWEVIFVLPVQKHSRALQFWEAGLRENAKNICTTAFEEIVDFKYTVMITSIYQANSF